MSWIIGIYLVGWSISLILLLRFDGTDVITKYIVNQTKNNLNEEEYVIYSCFWPLFIFFWLHKKWLK